MGERTLGYFEGIGSDLLAIAGGIVHAAILGAITWFIARLVSRLVARTMKSRRLNPNGSMLVSRLSFIAIWILGIGIILGDLGVNTTGLLAFLSASTVAISLSLQDMLRNFVSGLILLFERPFQVGDRIKVRDVVGEVQGIDLRTTLIRNTDGYLVMVPNSTIFTEIITNRSHFRTRRLKVTLTGDRTAMDGVEERLQELLGTVTGVRRPFPTPELTTSSTDEMVLSVSLLIESAPIVEHDLMLRLSVAFPNLSVVVIKPE